jgi:nitroimidazol reductase NimA-like FMN-containing flavoprotein (pyridoxamine 5'-phosphate oxidase superfamily)
LSPTERSTPHRLRDRTRSDRVELHALLDDAVLAHLSVVRDGAPFTVPTTFGRDGDTLYLHGSTGARSLRLADGEQVCLNVTHLDGLVYGRSVFHHSANYRSAVIHAQARLVTDPAEREHGLRVLVEHVTPGSWDHARRPNRKEMAATAVIAIDTFEAAVRVRTGPPGDEPEDVEAGTAWAGVVPVTTVYGAPEPCPLLPAGFATPPHVAHRSA